MLNGGNLSILSLQIWTPEKHPKDFIESDDSNVQGPMSFLGSMKIVENHVVIMDYECYVTYLNR